MIIKATETTGTTTATAMVPPAESPPPPPDSEVELGREAVELVIGESVVAVGRLSDVVGSSVDVKVRVVAEDDSDDEVDSVVSEEVEEVEEVVGVLVVSGSLLVVSLVEVEVEDVVGSGVLVSDGVGVSEGVVGSGVVDCCGGGGGGGGGGVGCGGPSVSSGGTGPGVSCGAWSEAGFSSVGISGGFGVAILDK